MMTPTEEVLRNVISHTHCIEKVEDGDSLISKFAYEHRFCDNVKIGETSKEEDMTITYMPTFILHMTNKEDCSNANIHLVSNIGHFVINVLETHMTTGCLICILRDSVKGMTLEEFVEMQISIDDGSVH